MNPVALKQQFLLFCFLCIALPCCPAPGQTRTNNPSLAFGTFEPNLPILFLDAKQPIESEEKVPCSIKILCPKGTPWVHTNALSAGAKPHGGMSRGLPKKSYSFALDAPLPLLGMRDDENWVLNAAYIDRSLMRHKLSYDLFRSLSIPSAPRYAVDSRFVELYHNGRYEGVYLLMERVDRRLLNLRPFRSNDVSHACIYKAIDHAANFSQPGHAGYEQREPNPGVKEYWRQLDSLNKLVSTAPADKFWDGLMGIPVHLDLNNAIDFHLLVLLTSNSDGITKNFILARDFSPPGKLLPGFFFVPWDYDGTFGQNWDASPYPPNVWLSNNLFDRLLENKKYRDQFIARWKSLRESQFSVKTIHALIDANVKTLDAAARRNALRWPATHGYSNQLDFQQDIAQMKTWVVDRVAWLDHEILTTLPSRYK